MERLTIPDKKIPGGTRRTIIDARAVREEAMTIYWALKKYEDTGLTPEEVEELNSFERSQVGKMLKKLNEEQRKHRWIPVEERLPENREDILVYTKRGCILVAWYGPRGKKWHIVPSEVDMLHEDIAAWMPLPEPYQQEE